MDTFRIACIDLDGTLLNNKHLPSEDTVKQLQHLERQGFRICIATGRSSPALVGTAKLLQLEGELPVVCFNGARGMVLRFDKDANGGPTVAREVFTSGLSKESSDKALAFAKHLGYTAQYYTNDEIYVTEKNEHTDRYTDLTGVRVRR
jgi:hydroxymethylpyrimidine pyrophosphatase-like HAD family hydrolase